MVVVIPGDEVAMPENLWKVNGLVFSQFDNDGNGAVDPDERRWEVREILFAVADLLGFLSVDMVVVQSNLCGTTHNTAPQKRKAIKIRRGIPQPPAVPIKKSPSFTELL